MPIRRDTSDNDSDKELSKLSPESLPSLPIHISDILFFKHFIDIALASKEREAPEYIQMDEKNKKFKFVRIPKFEEVPYPVVMEPNLVIEYYSR